MVFSISSALQKDKVFNGLEPPSGGCVLSVLTQFLSNRSQHVMVDG